MKREKKRLDSIVQKLNPDITRAQAQAYIMRGYVLVDNKVVTKPGTAVTPHAVITVHVPQERYVSRAGYKLAAALETFSIHVQGKVVLDAGISTGGFSDCLLQQGAERIYGIDVGQGLVHERIRTNPRLILYEKTNLRYLEPLPEPVDLVTLDLSFISVLKVIDVVASILKPGGELIVLIKPQFEAGRHQVGRGGIVSDPRVHAEVIKTIQDTLSTQGFAYQGHIASPLLGSSGNQEFLAYFHYHPPIR